MKDKKKSPLAHFVTVECARRGWNWSDVARLAISKTGRKGSVVAARNTILTRVDRPAPTMETYELMALIFKWSTTELIERIKAETQSALALGTPVLPTVEYTMTAPTVVTLWRAE